VECNGELRVLREGKSWRPALYCRLGCAAGVAWAEVIQSGAASFMHTGKPVVGPPTNAANPDTLGKVSRNRAGLFAAPRVQDDDNRGFVKTKGATTTHCLSDNSPYLNPHVTMLTLVRSRLRFCSGLSTFTYRNCHFRSAFTTLRFPPPSQERVRTPTRRDAQFKATKVRRRRQPL